MSKSKADKEPQAEGKKKGKGVMMIAMVGVAMLALGGGGAFALVKAGVIGGEKKHEDNSPKLIRKGDTDPYAVKAEGDKEGGGAEVEGEGGSPYKTSYFVFPEEFTSNLKGSTALIQVTVACSTHRDGRVVQWLKKHELAERSAMLEVFADTPEEQLGTMAGKEALQKRLAGAINKVLIEEEGFGGVDAVYFKTFIVQ